MKVFNPSCAISKSFSELSSSSSSSSSLSSLSLIAFFIGSSVSPSLSVSRKSGFTFFAFSLSSSSSSPCSASSPVGAGSSAPTPGSLPAPYEYALTLYGFLSPHFVTSTVGSSKPPSLVGPPGKISALPIPAFASPTVSDWVSSASTAVSLPRLP